MHPIILLAVLIHVEQASCGGLTTHYASFGGKAADELAVSMICPLPRGQVDSDLLFSHQNASSDGQASCAWSDNHQQQYCVFADPQFNNGKGISVITTPERARHILKSEAALSSHTKASPEPSLFRTRPSGTKGRGIFATEYIPAGSLITQEPPILFLDRNWIEAVSSEQVRTAMQTLSVEELPRTTREIFRELYAGPVQDNLQNRMWTNGYSVSGGPVPQWPGLDDESDLGMVAVHANISKINHSCRPNAAAQWDWDALAHSLYAARDIAADEEITISYINPFLTLRYRQEYTNSTLGFECACSQCKAARRFADLSDDRINEILLLESYLENRQIAPAEPTAMAELLVSLYTQEGLHTFMCKAYAIAAREWNGAGYEYHARRWAYESVRAGLIAGSETGMDAYLSDMEALLDGSRRHWSWRYRVHM
ncbi:SET domain-containing protein 5 [Colletotrichum orbiculare MAFF 240422]|uniref:SET domain-containing protein 5 n=1 Tax=Colletotrichum orbiculare (strain 104-T / ATCC 96160 / CBS 514.97 / LARS 414 / MAFF 240422) TaxID=1213857 RepID=N4VJC2_COLOR|nr:SET domain-containing protein 5 [Colletotrichum orbiculare MAFF 240422]